MSLNRLREAWEEYGQTDPLWAVLVRPERRHGRWSIDEFFETAQADVGEIRSRLDLWGLDLGDRVLDFGCGVGRLTNTLVRHANEVVGIDISSSMIAKANEINTAPQQVRFVHYDGTRLPFVDDSFDGAISLITLQHSPPEVQIACLVELHRVVRPGGVLAVQLPTRRRHAPPLDPAHRRAEIEPLSVPRELTPGQCAQARLRVTNRSEVTWQAESEIRLGNHWLRDGETELWDDGRTDLPLPVEPGKSVEATVPITAPDSPGSFEVEFDLLQEYVSWWATDDESGLRVLVQIVDQNNDQENLSSQTSKIGTPAEDDDEMDMFGIEPTLVSMIFGHLGGSVLEAVPNDMAGEEWDSLTYYIRAG